MIPILYEKNETEFVNNGIGRLTDAFLCDSEEELNGLYEIRLSYPIEGKYASYLVEQRIIYIKPNEVSNPQPYRIYQVTKQLARITVNARHLSYDLIGYPVAPFTATGVVPALNGLVTHAMIPCPFTVWTDITNTTSRYTQTSPASFRQRLGGVRGSILDTFLGEYEWDCYTVKLHAHRGSDHGVTIRYGKNLTDFNNERSNETFYTGCLAYWESDEDSISGQIQYIANHETYPTEKILVLDASSDFDEKPSEEQLTNRASRYISDNNIGLPFKDNLKINFIQLWQTEEYKSVAPLERVSLGDTVHVLYKDFDVPMKVISYTYDCLAERYTSMELGTKKASFASAITKPIEAQIDTKVGNIVSTLSDAVQRATALISGGLGGYVVINTNASGQPNEILILDAPSLEEAVNVIRMNMNGIAFSSTGYGGDYTTAWTIDGNFNADFITAGTIDGNLIRAASILTSALEVSAYDAVTGSIENITYDGSGMHIARKDPTTGAIVSDYQSLFTELGMRVMDSQGNVTLSAEQDTVDAVNLTSHQYFRIADDASATNSRFQGFMNSIHQKFQFGIFWEK